MTPPYALSVIVPVINRSQLAAEMLEGLINNAAEPDEMEIILVDNGSQPPTLNALRYVARRYHNVTLIENKRNEGFGPANNIGAKVATGRVLVFTQPDVRFSGDVIAAVDSVKDNILYGARLLSHDTGWNNFNGTIVPYLEGWFLACTDWTWKKLGGFDPRYVPADFEDVDLCWQARHVNTQLQQLVVPAVHERPGSSGWDQFKDREKTTVRNRTLFQEKWSL